MKKLMLFPVLIFPLVLNAQKIKSKEIDKFSGVITTSTTKENLSVQAGYPWVAVTGYIFSDPKSKTEQFSLFFHLKGQGTGSLIPGQSTVTLLTDKEESISLTYNGKYDLFTNSDINVTMYVTPTEEQLQLLANSSITDIRIYTSKQSDYTVKEKQRGVIASIAKLLLENKSSGEAESASESPTSSLADELKKLKDLLDSGALTQEEYDAAKKKLLGQ